MSTLPAFPALRPRDYFTDKTLPSVYDDAIGDIIVAAAAGTAPEQPLCVLTVDEAWLLIAFAARMATLSVRERSPERLNRALVALAVEGGKLDLRETIQMLALILDAAHRIGTPASPLFSSAASIVRNARVAEVMLTFPERPVDMRTIESMGYIAVGDGGTFEYRRRW
jgi:hypothetical protein